MTLAMVESEDDADAASDIVEGTSKLIPANGDVTATVGGVAARATDSGRITARAIREAGRNTPQRRIACKTAVNLYASNPAVLFA